MAARTSTQHKSEYKLFFRRSNLPYDTRAPVPVSDQAKQQQAQQQQAQQQTSCTKRSSRPVDDISPQREGRGAVDLSSRIMNPTRSTPVPRRLSIDALHHHGGGGGGPAKGTTDLMVPSIHPPTCVLAVLLSRRRRRRQRRYTCLVAGDGIHHLELRRRQHLD